MLYRVPLQTFSQQVCYLSVRVTVNQFCPLNPLQVLSDGLMKDASSLGTQLNLETGRSCLLTSQVAIVTKMGIPCLQSPSDHLMR